MKSLSKIIQAGKTTDFVKDWKPTELEDHGSASAFQFPRLDDAVEEKSFSSGHANINNEAIDFQPIVFPVEQLKNGKALLFEAKKTDDENRVEREEFENAEILKSHPEEATTSGKSNTSAIKDLFVNEGITKDRLINKTSPVFSIKPWILEDLSSMQFEEAELMHKTSSDPGLLLEIENEKKDLIDRREKAEQEIQLAQSQVEKMRGEAERLLLEAEQNTAALLDETNSQIEQIREKAYAEGMEKAKEDSACILKNVEVVVSETIKWREQILSQSEATIVDMIRMIGKKLFGGGYKLDAHGVEEMVARAIGEASRLGNLRMYLNPQDEDLLVSLWQETEVMLNGQKIQLVASSNILPGGCFIEGEFGTLDSRVESQVDLIDKEIGLALLNKDKEVGTQT
jgi:flagellar biosynthesis/type III secretory pathway protein FliH